MLLQADRSVLFPWRLLHQRTDILTVGFLQPISRNEVQPYVDVVFVLYQRHVNGDSAFVKGRITRRSVNLLRIFVVEYK